MGVNFVTSSANFSNDLKKLRIKGASDGRVKSDDDLTSFYCLEKIIEVYVIRKVSIKT